TPQRKNTRTPPRRYAATPEDVKAELIRGVVHMPSPLRRPHGLHHLALGALLWHYQAATPGVEGLDNTTTILDEDKEPQPDLSLRILPEWGGQSQTNKDDYVVGAPELVAEVAHSSRDIDMHEKRDDYREAGVVEYLVFCIEEGEVHWFHFASGRPIKANRQGTYRSRVFPGLWIDGPALAA